MAAVQAAQGRGATPPMSSQQQTEGQQQHKCTSCHADERTLRQSPQRSSRCYWLRRGSGCRRGVRCGGIREHRSSGCRRRQ